MNEPRLSKQAEADLDELWLYIAANNPDAADRMLTLSWKAAGCMSAFPTWAKAATTFGRAFAVLSSPPTSSSTGR